MKKMLKRFWRWHGSIGRIIVIAGSLVIVACEPIAIERVESLESQQKMNLTRDDRQHGEQAYQLPAWFEENRVQGHTRLSVKKWLGTPEFANGATGFAQLGAVVFSRHVKTGQEDPWWPSKVPVVNGRPLLINQPNHIKQMIEEGRAKGMRMLAYYFHSTDKTIAILHPEWVCKQPDGKVVAHRRRGDYLDITSPYREIVLQRLLELAEMGVDGFFFDEVHMPYDGCWGTPLQEAFRQETGREAPTVIDDRDPDYRRYLQFTASQVEETFAYWRDSVHRQYPEVVFEVSTTTVPALINPRMTTNLVRLADSSKNEFFLATAKRLNMRVFEQNSSLAQPADDIRMALGWTLLRDAADGRPPRIYGGGMPNQEQALAFASALVTYGAIANMGVSEVNLLSQKSSDQGTPREALKSAFALGRLPLSESESPCPLGGSSL
ncbi:MAG: hypothetical protein GDA56_08110 [Hormoscilla sp. GM7CHS1pb]|nr:hypothetical protein [Hormoscilla sp. GM7CHS1pb]